MRAIIVPPLDSAGPSSENPTVPALAELCGDTATGIRTRTAGFLNRGESPANRAFSLQTARNRVKRDYR
jgi:hypothetical protein